MEERYSEGFSKHFEIWAELEEDIFEKVLV
jgi:hypothetical protein